MMDKILDFLQKFFSRMAIPSVRIVDVIEILLLAILVYYIVKWIKRTRAWIIVKGLAVLLLAWIVAYLLEFNVILWIFANTITVGITAIIILFQPEFRNALEQLGQRNVLNPLNYLAPSEKARFSDATLEQLLTASFELAKTKTGALMVIECETPLADFEKTGIAINGAISSQLLINIFEHNTPLHDGAVIIRGDRIMAATCYLPVSDNMRISKELGTRHRAGLGISEVSDSCTIIVSEETGKVSIAQRGELLRNVSQDMLRNTLRIVQNKTAETTKLTRILKRVGKSRKNGEKK